MIKVWLFKKVKRAGVRSKFWMMGWYTIDASGRRKRQQKSTGTERKSAAQIIANEWQLTLSRRTIGTDNSAELKLLPYDTVVEAFLEAVKLERRLSTAGVYKNSLDIFARICKPNRVSAITAAMLQGFKQQRIKEGVTKSTLNRDLRVIRRLLRWSLDTGYLDLMPKVGMVPMEEPKPPDRISRDDIRKLMDTLSQGKAPLYHQTAEFWLLAIRLFHFTACRKMELFLLRWSDFDAERATLVIRGTHAKSRKTGVLALSPDIVERLVAWKLVCSPKSDDELLMPRTAEVRRLWEEWKKIRKAAGLPHVAWKTFRSTCASELAEQFPIAVAQAHLRHSSPLITQRYYINTTEALRVAAASHKPL